MKKFRITKRDVFAFFLGFISLLIIETIFDWEGVKKAFIEGWNDGSRAAKIESDQ